MGSCGGWPEMDYNSFNELSKANVGESVGHWMYISSCSTVSSLLCCSDIHHRTSVSSFVSQLRTVLNYGPPQLQHGPRDAHPCESHKGLSRYHWLYCHVPVFPDSQKYILLSYNWRCSWTRIMGIGAVATITAVVVLWQSCCKCPDVVPRVAMCHRKAIYVSI